MYSCAYGTCVVLRPRPALSPGCIVTPLVRMCWLTHPRNKRRVGGTFFFFSAALALSKASLVAFSFIMFHVGPSSIFISCLSTAGHWLTQSVAIVSSKPISILDDSSVLTVSPLDSLLPKRIQWVSVLSCGVFFARTLDNKTTGENTGKVRQ